jgi:hypothetical protein
MVEESGVEQRRRWCSAQQLMCIRLSRQLDTRFLAFELPQAKAPIERERGGSYTSFVG